MAHSCNQNEALLREEAENDAVMVAKETDAVIVVPSELLDSTPCGVGSKKLNLFQCFDFHLSWQAASSRSEDSANSTFQSISMLSKNLHQRDSSLLFPSQADEDISLVL